MRTQRLNLTGAQIRQLARSVGHEGGPLRFYSVTATPDTEVPDAVALEVESDGWMVRKIITADGSGTTLQISGNEM